MCALLAGACEAGYGTAAAFATGAVEGGVFGAVHGFGENYMMTGNLQSAAVAGLWGGGIGVAIGGPLGAIFHELCFTAGTPVDKQNGKRPIECQSPCCRAMTLETLARAHLPGDDPTAIDPKQCRLVRLKTIKPFGAGNVLKAELVRHLSWFEQNQVVVGGKIRFQIPEMGVDSEADVMGIEPCPPVEPGRGRAITGRFVTTNCRVLLVKHSGEDKPLEPTPQHRFMSLDRNDWIAAEDLEVGERLQTKTGQIVTVESVSEKPGLHDVYNIEVEGEHHYFVGESGVLVHNGYATTEGVPNGPVRSEHYSSSPEGVQLYDGAQAFREAQGLSPQRNVAVADVLTDGKPETVRFVNDPGGMHSEQRLIAWDQAMQERGVSVEVQRVYSDRPPCGDLSANCANNLGNRYGQNLEVYHGNL